MSNGLTYLYQTLKHDAYDYLQHYDKGIVMHAMKDRWRTGFLLISLSNRGGLQIFKVFWQNLLSMVENGGKTVAMFNP